MIGAQIGEGRGKRTGRRLIATQPSVKVGASVEEMAPLLGVEGTSIIAYTAHIKPDGPSCTSTPRYWCTRSTTA